MAVDIKPVLEVEQLSDDKKFGGIGVKNSKTVNAEPIECEGKKNSISMNLPPLSVMVYKFDYK